MCLSTVEGFKIAENLRVKVWPAMPAKDDNRWIFRYFAEQRAAERQGEMNADTDLRYNPGAKIWRYMDFTKFMSILKEIKLCCADGRTSDLLKSRVDTP